MLEFFKENWLSLIGALAWLPIVVELLMNLFRRVHGVYLDRHFIHDLKFTKVRNGKKTVKTGMVLILAINLFVYKQSFFPKKINCCVTLKNGAKHHSTLYEGGIGYSDTEEPLRKYVFSFPQELNMNMKRAIFANQDNIRIIPFFFENLNMSNDENIKKIVITFHGRIFNKKLTVKNTDLAGVQFINQFDDIVQ